MKKLALISLISLMLVGIQAQAEMIRTGGFYDGEPLEEMEQEFFETGKISNPDTAFSSETEEASYNDYTIDSGFGTRQLRGMPLFKKYRIKLQNHYKIKEHEEQIQAQKRYQEELQKYQEQYNKAVEDISEEDLDELKNRSLRKVYVDEDGNEVRVSGFDKFKNFFTKFKKSKSKKSAGEDETDSENAELSQDGEKASVDGETALAGGVREIVAQKDMILDCDKLNYDDETSELEATGHPIMKFPPQGVTIKADRLTYNTESNIIKAYDNVAITRNGDTIYGDYVMINMNDESSIVTNMKADKMNLAINAKDVVASEDTIELHDGSLVGDKHYKLRLRSSMAGRRLENYEIPPDDRSSISKNGLDINVKAKEIYVTAKKNHDVITVKDADIYYKDNYITRWGSFTAHTNKDHEYFEANYPEIGTIPRIGMFAGPGFVFDIPNGATMKFIPFLNYKDKFGLGAGLKYRSGTNYTEAFYGSANDMFVLRGRQDLDDNFYLQYGVNSYLDEWWMGSGLSKYRAEAVYRDSYIIPNTLGLGRNARFRQRVAAGYIQESDYNRKGEKLGRSTLGTTRLKYMAEISQNLFSYRNDDTHSIFNLSWVLQGSAAIYGTGDTQFIARTGPRLHTQYKRWSQDIMYFLAGKEDNTPIRKADIYRLGRSNLVLRETFRLNKWLTVSWLMSSALSNDAPNHKKFQENGLYFSIGPDDLKLSLGYDFIRERSYVYLSTALDLKGSRVDYKKMVIKNPEKLTKNTTDRVEPVVFPSGQPRKIRRTNAQVINIEDPDKEQL